MHGNTQKLPQKHIIIVNTCQKIYLNCVTRIFSTCLCYGWTWFFSFMAFVDGKTSSIGYRRVPCVCVCVGGTSYNGIVNRYMESKRYPETHTNCKLPHSWKLLVLFLCRCFLMAYDKISMLKRMNKMYDFDCVLVETNKTKNCRNGFVDNENSARNLWNDGHCRSSSLAYMKIVFRMGIWRDELVYLASRSNWTECECECVCSVSESYDKAKGL